MSIPAGQGGAHIFKTGSGICVITRVTAPEGSEKGRIFWAPDITTPLTQVYETTVARAYFDYISCSAHNDGVLDLVLAGEYGRGGDSRSVLLSEDGGQTFTPVRASSNADPTVNSHWHTVEYDPVEGIIWAANGDTHSNAQLHWSDDMGDTWQVFPDPLQPTCIVPMQSKVVFGRDETWFYAGAYSIHRNYTPNDVTFITTEFDILPLVGSPAQYGQSNSTVDEETFISFPRQISVGSFPHLVYATGDDGRSWVILDSDMTEPVNGLVRMSDTLYCWRSGRKLSSAPVPTWSTDPGVYVWV